jgi:hypothetical protein
MSMFLWATIEGLFGIKANSLKREVAIHPQFPKDWTWAAIEKVPVGKALIELRFDLDRREIKAENLGEENVTLKLDGKAVEL